MVTPSFHPMIGGVESYVRGVGGELVKLGYEIDVYTPDSVLGVKIERKEEIMEGMRIHRLPVSVDLSYRLKLWPSLVGAISARGHDLVHVYSHDTYALFAGIAVRRGGTPLLVTTYGPFQTHSTYGFLKARLLGAYDATMTPSIFKMCDRVLVRYPEIAAWVSSFGIPNERISLEPSGIPPGYLDAKDGVDAREKLFGEGPALLYLGRIAPQKGVQFAVQAMSIVKKRFPTARLALVGPDYVGYSHFLRQRIDELGLGENVTLNEPVTDQEEESEILGACDVFLMPSSFEGFSQAVMKGMARSKPVVVTRVGGLPYEVGYGECGVLSEFGDATSLANGILTLLQSRELAETMGRNGRKRAEEFTLDRLAVKLSSVYNAVMAG